MAALVVDASANYDLCSGQTTGATLDTFAVNNGQLIINTDTKFCSGHVTSATASNGSIDSVTVSSTAVAGEFKLDGTGIWIIPITGGSGLAPVPIATSLVPTAVSWSAGFVTLTFGAAHGYVLNDRIGVGSIKGSELVNAYSGVFSIASVPTTTTLTYALAVNPGTATITSGKVVKYFKCSQTTSNAVLSASWSAGVASFAIAISNSIAQGNTVTISGISPSGYNGVYTVLSVLSGVITVALVSNPGTYTSGGTVSKTIDSSYLGFWAAFTAGPTVATISATGWIKVKDVVNGPFDANIALNIQGGTAPTAISIDAGSRGWIEVVGAELGTTPATFTIPRLGKFTVTGDWFYPKTLPFVLATGTTWSANANTYTTSAAHGLAVGSLATISGANPVGYNGVYTVVSVPTTTTFTVTQLTNPGIWTSGGAGWGELRTNGVANQTIQLPASGGTTAGTTSYAGVWIERDVGTAGLDTDYIWYTSVGNATATAAMFPTDGLRGAKCHMGAAGLLRIGGDGTNAWGFIPTAGRRIRIANVICVNATKVATTGVITQTVPNATLTNRPKFLTTGAGVIEIDKWMTSWYLSFVQPFSVSMKYVGCTESMLLTEIIQPFSWTQVNTGVSVIASSVQTSAINISTCYAGGTMTNCTFDKFHNGVSGYYSIIASDCQNFTFTGCQFGVLFTSANGGATARNATSGTMSLTRVSASTWNNSVLSGGQILHTTNSNLKFYNTVYLDSSNVTATTATTPMYVHSFNSYTNNILVDGISFGNIYNVHPYSGFVIILSASNNIKVRNVGSVSAPLALGPIATSTGSLWVGATAGAGANIEFKRIYTTNARVGLVASADNSYTAVKYESCWFGNALLLSQSMLNVTATGLGQSNSVTGQSSVYGFTWADYFTPIGATLSNAAWSAGVITYTTAAAHRLLGGNTVTISGAVAATYNNSDGYNGTYVVLASATGTTFTVTQATNPTAWVSGGTTNPLTGKVVLQMNEQTADTVSYVVERTGPGSGFTSAGTLALVNLKDSITWETPNYIVGHYGFTSGVTSALPTFTATNPNNHDWFYDINTGDGYSGVYKNLKYTRAGFATTITSPTLLLTPVTASVTGSISGSTLTVTAVGSGFLYVGMTLSGAGITAGTVITDVIDSITGKVGSYTVAVMTVASGAYTISASTQIVSSVAISASTSVYGISVGDSVYNITTASAITLGTKVTSINSLVQITASANSNSTTSSQVFGFAAIHDEAGIVAAGFKLKVRCVVNTVATTNLLTTVAIPTLTNAVFQQLQYPLDTIILSLDGLQPGSDIVIVDAGTVTPRANIDDNSSSSYKYTYATLGNVDIGIFKAGYVPFHIRSYSLSSTNAAIPIAQVVDRAYS